MSKSFIAKLGERMIGIFVFVYGATYAAGSVDISFHEATSMTIAQRALVAGLAAVVQLLLGVFVGSRVGDTSSPSLLPLWVLRKLGVNPQSKTATQLVVTLDDVVSATVKQLLLKHPDLTDVTAADVAAELLKPKMVAPAKVSPPEPSSADIP